MSTRHFTLQDASFTNIKQKIILSHASQNGFFDLHNINAFQNKNFFGIYRFCFQKNDV